MLTPLISQSRTWENFTIPRNQRSLVWIHIRPLILIYDAGNTYNKNNKSLTIDERTATYISGLKKNTHLLPTSCNKMEFNLKLLPLLLYHQEDFSLFQTPLCAEYNPDQILLSGTKILKVRHSILKTKNCRQTPTCVLGKQEAAASLWKVQGP